MFERIFKINLQKVSENLFTIYNKVNKGINNIKNLGSMQR